MLSAWLSTSQTNTYFPMNLHMHVLVIQLNHMTVKGAVHFMKYKSLACDRKEQKSVVEQKAS